MWENKQIIISFDWVLNISSKSGAFCIPTRNAWKYHLPPPQSLGNLLPEPMCIIELHSYLSFQLANVVGHILKFLFAIFKNHSLANSILNSLRSCLCINCWIWRNVLKIVGWIYNGEHLLIMCNLFPQLPPSPTLWTVSSLQRISVPTRKHGFNIAN